MSGAHFATRGPIVDALADEPIEAVNGETPPRDTSGKNESPCPDDVATVERYFARRRVDAGDRARDRNFRPKSPCLLECATRKFVARDAARKSEIVFNP
jgi:hypothetical protein